MLFRKSYSNSLISDTLRVIRGFKQKQITKELCRILAYAPFLFG